jgi:hypothetical protein
MSNPTEWKPRRDKKGLKTPKLKLQGEGKEREEKLDPEPARSV